MDVACDNSMGSVSEGPQLDDIPCQASRTRWWLHCREFVNCGQRRLFYCHMLTLHRSRRLPNIGIRRMHPQIKAHSPGCASVTSISHARGCTAQEAPRRKVMRRMRGADCAGDEHQNRPWDLERPTTNAVAASPSKHPDTSAWLSCVGHDGTSCGGQELMLTDWQQPTWNANAMKLAPQYPWR
jgi:hypothetical protein